MIPEIATAFLALSTLIAFCMAGCAIPSFGASPSLSKRLSTALFLLVSLSFGLLVAAYIRSDFSLLNVFQNSHTAKPLIYKITGSWGNHEGSMLLWVWVLTAFAFAYSRLARPNDAEAQQVYISALAILGLVAAGFLIFILYTSNPFARLVEPPVQGRDLNPLLQDIGLAIHPPLLYLGYVGFAAVFALAIAALLARQEIGPIWARQVRPWALLAWGFLTAGIGLGSWWAYRELGWGGWWFWDPVENVSLLPWLAGTALIHCLLVLAKRPVLQNWTLLLAIFTFTFSLLGTFLVRSGLLTSVHSFASDPTRGLYVLGFIGLVTGGSLWLYALRYPRMSPPDFMPVSREGGIMVNNVLLATLCATVLLGIVYPLLMQVFEMPSVSVGAPYYNMIVVPFAIPVLLFAGLMPLLPWREASWKTARRPLMRAATLALAALAVVIILQWSYLKSLLAMPLAWLVGLVGVWMLGATVAYARRAYRAAGALRLTDAGLVLAHGGLAIFAVAAAFATAGRVEVEQRLEPGGRMEAGGYEFVFAALNEERQDNYDRKRATLHVTALDNSNAFTLRPETRFYPSRGMETAEAAINGGLRRDVYTAIATGAVLGNSDSQEDAVILRVYILPAMWWLWLGFVLASGGGIIAALGYFRSAQTIK